LTTRQHVRDKTKKAGEEAAGYQLLTTGPVPLHVDQSVRVYRPLWLSWELPLDPHDRKPLPDVAQLTLAKLAEDQRVMDVRLDYLRVRALPNGRLKGRAKISVALDEGLDRADDRTGVPPVLSDLCPWAQREVISKLTGTDMAARAVTVRLAWRERWIGRAAGVV
jgi:hypothetical protein